LAAAPPARLSRPKLDSAPPLLVGLRADPKPVEVDDVGWATRQVGLDLHALKVEQPEGSQADPNTTVAILRNEAAHPALGHAAAGATLWFLPPHEVRKRPPVP